MTDYTVAAEFTLKDNVSLVLDRILEKLDKATRAVAAFQEQLDKIGGAGINRLVKSLEKLENARFPGQLAEGAERFDKLLGGADEKMAAMARHAAELAAAMKDIRVPSIPMAPGGGGPGRAHGGHGSGDPVMQGIAGGAVLDFMGGNFDRFRNLDQVYRAMQSDRNLAGSDNPLMAAIRGQASGQLDRYRVLTPLDVAKNAGEAYAISGGKMAEQGPIADMLDRLEANMVLRGKDPADAQRQATALIKAADVSNRFYDPKTGDFSLNRANAEMGRLQALVAVGGGFTSGQSVLSFEKSAGLAGQRLSLEGEAALAHFVEVNPSRSGTMLRSFESLFGGHATRMTSKDKAAWTAAGLYDKSGMLVDNDAMYADPLGWMEKHSKQLSSTLISDRVQRQTVATLLAEAHGSQSNIDRQTAAVFRSNVDANSGNLLGSPQGKFLQFDASLERFRVTLGKFEAGPGVMILDKLTAGLDKLDKVMEAHPAATDTLLKLTAAIAALAVVRGAASLLGIGEGLGALGKGISLLSKGNAAGGALETITAAAGGGSLFAFATAIAAVGAALVTLPPFLKYLLGDPSQNTHPNTNAHGMGYSNRTPGTGPQMPAVPQGQSWGDWFSQGWHDSQHPTQRGNARGLQPTHAAYTGGGTMQPIVNVYLDSEPVAHRVEHRMATNASRPSAYGNAPDPMEVAARPGMPLVSF